MSGSYQCLLTVFLLVLGCAACDKEKNRTTLSSPSANEGTSTAVPSDKMGKGGSKDAQPTPENGRVENGKGSKAGKGGRGNKGGRDSGPIAVRVDITKFAVAARSVSVTAVLDGRSQAEVYTKVTGRISYIGPKEGEAVKSGTVLFRVDRNDPGETFLNTPVVSPINGWVGRWMVNNIGAQVTTSSPVVNIVDDDFLRATIYLSTPEWVVINDQAAVQVTVGEESRSGKIIGIARAADSITGRGSAVIEVENRNHRWRVGMISRVQVDLEPKLRMLVSSAAVNITDQGSYVFVVVEGVSHKTPVTFVLIDSDTVEILEGIKDGSALVVAGGNYLTDKSAVKVVTDEAIDKVL